MKDHELDGYMSMKDHEIDGYVPIKDHESYNFGQNKTRQLSKAKKVHFWTFVSM